MQAQRQDLLTSLGLLILRLGVGPFMVAHGWGKLKMVLAGKFEEFGDPIGLGPGVSLVLTMLAEFACALLVMLGCATRFAAAPIVFAMAVAAMVVHADDPWTMSEGARRFFAQQSQTWSSKEPALLFLIPFLALIFTGPGRFSFDALVWPRWRERQARRKAAEK